MNVDVWNSTEKRLHFELPDRTIDRVIEPYALLWAEAAKSASHDSAAIELLSSEGQVLFSGAAELEEQAGFRVARFPFPGVLPLLPRSAEVRIGGECQIVDVDLVRLWGKIRDFDGHPLRGGLLPLVRPRPFGWGYDVGMWRGDEQGWYECYVPKGFYRQNHMLLESYARTTLESYFYELHLSEDTRLDFRIGEVEVAKLAATPVDTDGLFALRFICWSINDTCLPLYAALDRGEEATYSDQQLVPKLTRDEVDFLVDGKEAEVVAFESVPVQIERRQLVPGWHVEAIFPDGLSRGVHRLGVVVSHRTKTPGGADVLERGEAQHFHLVYP